MICPGCGSDDGNNPTIVFEDGLLLALNGCPACQNYFKPYKGKEMQDQKIYNIRISSPFILTQNLVKSKLGIGYKVLEISVEKEASQVSITDVDTAIDSIMKTGYRALAMANHPDLGGDPEVMVILNKAKKELSELFASLKG